MDLRLNLDEVKLKIKENMEQEYNRDFFVQAGRRGGEKTKANQPADYYKKLRSKRPKKNEKN